MIVRPRLGAAVGRTMLKPPSEPRNVIHTGVMDTVHFFGQRLFIVAVPFMQQDSRLLTCSHVAAWMCHYTAVLDGRDIARRSAADFNLLANPSLALGRPLPSIGLNHYQISDLLRLFGLPPLHYSIKDLSDDDRSPDWPDRQVGLHSRVARICCRYVNSGLPIIVLLNPLDVGNPSHAIVVCGYTRDHGVGESGATSLLIHDDQEGPYRWVHDVEGGLWSVSRKYRWDELVAPLPDGLWLSGEAAERWGSQQLIDGAITAVEPEHGGTAGSPPQHLLDLLADGDLTLRSYALQSNRFKRRFAKNCGDNRAVEEYMYISLPRYVWIVEAVSRTRRKNGQPCVLGEAVYDATSDDDKPMLLALRLPGIVSISRPGQDAWEGRISERYTESSGRRSDEWTQ
jgi:hypothetical protein